MRRVADTMGEITTASQEQIAGIAQVRQAITQMDAVTQQNASLVVGRADLPLTAEQWIALADQALYRAKAPGRNRLEYAAEAGLA